MASDFLQDLVCTCRGKLVCARNCVCNRQNLSCTTVCLFKGSHNCNHGITLQTRFNDVYENEDTDEDFKMPVVCSLAFSWPLVLKFAQCGRQ